MDRKTERALKGSIAHWKRMRKDPNCGEGPNSRDCPLCAKFHKGGCRGCPVREKTGEAACFRTPYAAAHAAFCLVEYAHLSCTGVLSDGGYRVPLTLATVVWHFTADAEIAFLESLLPKKRKARR